MVMFAKTVVRERKIPFEIAAPKNDVYNEYNEKNRLVYRIEENTIEIIQCRTNYGDK